MAPDWLFYYLTRPLGALFWGGFIAIAFIYWRSILGRIYLEIGLLPLILSYIFFIAGLTFGCFIHIYIDFSSSIPTGTLAESQHWATVTARTIYLTILSLAIALPALTFFAVPISVFMIGIERFTYGNTVRACVVLWLLLTMLTGLNPSNEWESTHRLVFFANSMIKAFLIILFLPVPFLLGIHIGIKMKKRPAVPVKFPE